MATSLTQNFSKEEFKKNVISNCKSLYRKNIEEANQQEVFQAVSYAVKDIIIDKWIATHKQYEKDDPKMVYYMSMEFLMGRALGNNMINLCAYDEIKEALDELGLDINVIEDQEPDAALGNGGLGRLAACFMDSLATLEYPAYGCGIRYKYGMFKQEIKDGYQVEVPDNWLKDGNPFEIKRSEYRYEVKFGGYVRSYRDEKTGRDMFVQEDYRSVIAVPYDIPVLGYGNTLVLRPDMTPSIARAAAKYFEDHILPIKLCYVSNTFINVSKYYQGRLKENTVIGAELIDDASIDADYEIICMVIDCMKNAGLTEFQVELGNVAFFNGLLKDAGIKGDTYEELLNLINEKNYIGVEEILNNLNIDKNTAKVLLELPQLFGQAEVLDKARSLTNIPECIEAVDRLTNLYELLKINGYDKYVSFDLGELSNHTYYTGIIFHAFTFGTGEPIASGGRYDKLLGQFGCDKASIGFSLIIDRLMAAINRQNIEIEVEYSGVLLVYSEDKLQDAVKRANELRKDGINVCMIRKNNNKSESQYIEYAKASQLSDVVYI